MADSGVIFKEHVRIRKQLLATSHRYRLFIIACMVTITVSQFIALLLVLSSKYEKTFFNSGDLVVSKYLLYFKNNLRRYEKKRDDEEELAKKESESIRFSRVG